MKYEEILLNTDKKTYGSDYGEHILEIYKLYVEMADRISARRQTANSFFLSINSGMIAFFGLIKSKIIGSGQVSDFLWLIGVVGMILCYTWYRLIKSYKDMNSGKFKIIHEIEKLLPIRSYDAEWEALDRGINPDVYLQFTNIEMRIPLIFFFISTIIVLFSFPFWIFVSLFNSMEAVIWQVKTTFF